MRVIAHRGASGHELENSLAAFDAAIAMGADWLELDVQPCKSGELIVMHDALLDRTAEDDGALMDVEWADLQKMKLQNGEPISRLQDVLEHVGERAGVCIELKTPIGLNALSELMLRYDAQQHANWLAISFWHSALKILKERVPSMRTGAIIAGSPDDGAACAERVGAVALHSAFNFTDAALVEDAKMRGIAMHPWTVNEAEDIARAIALGVQGITSDYPDRVIEALKLK